VKAARRILGLGTFIAGHDTADSSIKWASNVKALGLTDSPMPSVPDFTEGGHDRAVFKIRVKLGDVTMPSAVGRSNTRLTEYLLSPGLAESTVKHATSIAGYQRYRTLGAAFMVFSKRQLGDNVSVGRLTGCVTTDVSVTVNCPADVDALCASSTTNAMTWLPHESVGLYVECDPAEIVGDKGTHGLKIRSGDVTGDVNEYDHAKFIVAAEAGSDTVNASVAEVYLVATIAAYEKNRDYNEAGHLRLLGSGVSTTTAPLGTAWTTLQRKGLCRLVTVAQSGNEGVITFDPRTVDASFAVEVIWYAAGAVTAAYPTMTLAGLTKLGILKNVSGGTTVDVVTNPPSGGSSNLVSIRLVVTVTGDGGTITFGTNGTFPTTLCQILVSAFNSSLQQSEY
jgi:hypothetical protein